jgi:hypothetical protein
MPHNEPCPACGRLIPDWHWEWHAEPGFSEIHRGTAGMECPLCGAVVMFAGAAPLTECPPGSQVQRVKRDIIKAAIWATVSQTGLTLERYLATAEGQPYSGCWTLAEIRQADQQAAAIP